MKAKLCLSYCLLIISNANAQWTLTKVDSNHNYTVVYFHNQNIGFLGGFTTDFNGCILKTANGGLSWDTLSIPGWQVWDFSFIDDSIGFVSGKDGYIFKTIDGGSTWTSLFSCTGLSDNPAIHMITEESGFALTSGGRIFRIDSISSSPCQFVFLTAGHGTNFYGEAEISLTNIYGMVAGGYGYVSRTMDGGQTWLSCNTDSLLYIYGSSQIDSNHYIVAGYDFGLDTFSIRTTSDGGLSWSNPVATPSLFIDLDMLDSMRGLAAGHDGNIYRTLDGGDSWEIEDSTADNILTSIRIVNDSFAIAVGWGGNMLVKHNKLFTGLNDLPGQVHKSVLYPNPFTNNIIVETDFPGMVNFKLYDVTGVRRLESLGYEKINLRTDDLNPGLYFFRLYGGDIFLKAGRIIKI